MQETPGAPSEVPPAWRAAEDAGFDMSVVATNLERTPWEQMVNHGRALATALALRLAMEEQRADD